MIDDLLGHLRAALALADEAGEPAIAAGIAHALDMAERLNSPKTEPPEAD